MAADKYFCSLIFNMKKPVLFAICIVTSVALFAQSKPKTPAKTVKTPPKTVAPKPLLKTVEDSVGYAIGISIGNSMKAQYMTKVNTALLLKGINDILSGKPVVMDDNAVVNCLNSYGEKMQEDNNPVVKAGRVFLDKNKLRPEVKTTPSGLQYEVIREGTGVKPRPIDTFVCHYRGTLLDSTEFDASYKRNEPLVMAVNQVIMGWREGLLLMGVGSKYKFYIPYTIGYGLRGYPPDIPGGSMLIFEVELLDVRKAAGY